jgi:hypothetical protein
MSIPAFSAPLVGLSDASADESVSSDVPLNHLSQVGGMAIWGAGCSAGQVVFEIAPFSGYSGTWEAKFTSDAQDDAVESFTFPGPFSGVGRWRITDAIVGGTVSTQTTGNVG